MIAITASGSYDKWLSGLKDVEGRARIIQRVNRIRDGNFGDCEPVKGTDGHVSELRMFFGPGYRVYIAQPRADLVVLLYGGDKSTQTKDAKKAYDIFKEWSKQ